MNYDASKKIIVAGACEFPEGGGGAPRCMRMLAKGFALHGHSVLVTTNYGSWECGFSIALDGFNARCFGNGTPEGSKIHVIFDRIRSHLLLLAYLLRLTVKNKYDLLLFYGPVISFAVVVAFSRLMRRRTAYLMADIQHSPPEMRLSFRIKRLIIEFVDFVLARSSSLMIVLGTSILEGHYRRIAPRTKQMRIWAPIDTKLFASGDGDRIRRRYRLFGRKVVSYAGALDTLEGIPLLIAAIKQVALKHPEVALIIAGHEKDIDRVVGKKIDFQEMVRKLGVEDNVIFTGHIPQNEIIDLLAASDVLVMPKIDHLMNHVASPIKIAEYLAAGCPVVSSNICELDIVLQHKENVLFCEPGNVEELDKNIDSLLNDVDLCRKLAENAAKVAELIFDYRICTKNILDKII